MAYKKEPLEGLKQFIPEGTYSYFLHYLQDYAIQLKVTKERHSIQGNFIYKQSDKKNKISINGNLNPYAFALTLIHEIAHCICVHKNGFHKKPHGIEWKSIYSELLNDFMNLKVLPQDLFMAVMEHAQRPTASCSDMELEVALSQYDTTDSEEQFLEEVPIGNIIMIQKEKYLIVSKRRTRYLCRNLKNNSEYLISRHARVKIWIPEN
jgi:hypothetical protein